MGLPARRVRPAAIAIVTGFAVVAVTVAGAALPVTVKSTTVSALDSTILVSASGRTLYHNSFEKKNVVKCTGSCAAQWPPLVIAATAKPVAGPGVTASLLGTVKRSDGKLQVTYHGLPLYRYSGDKKAGDVKGQGAGGIWHALAPSGSVVMKAVTTSSGTSATSGSGSSTGSGSNTGTGSGTTTTTGTDCATNPGGYGCM
jgi:predicted lipoprotein with Yx(FWY)xxD motif